MASTSRSPLIWRLRRLSSSSSRLQPGQLDKGFSSDATKLASKPRNSVDSRSPATRERSQGPAFIRYHMYFHPKGPLVPAYKKFPPTPRLSVKPNSSGIHWETEKGDDGQIDGRWLREMCTCSACRHPDTAQKKINVLQLPADSVRPRMAREVDQDGVRGYEVEFRDGHRTFVPFKMLSTRDKLETKQDRAGFVEPQVWDSSISTSPPTVSYSDVQAGPGMATLLRKISSHGFAFISDMPATPEASQALLESIGPIRNTHYGGFYDFTSDLSSKDTAYTAEALEPHTDNTYFTEPAGLQALHMLSHTDGSGGESSLVDGFKVANDLYRENNRAYTMLSSTGVHAHASGNEGVNVQPAQPTPVLVHHRELGCLQQVRWNTADRGGVATSQRLMGSWYDAATAFDRKVNDRQNQCWFRLEPGKMLLFDNWRVMHGRAAFTGKRRMCGGYINHDDFISRYRTSNLSAEELAGSTVTG